MRSSLPGPAKLDIWSYSNMADNYEILRVMGERISSLETAITYMGQNIHALRKTFHKSDFNPLWLRVVILINTGIFAWLSVLTYLVVQK